MGFNDFNYTNSASKNRGRKKQSTDMAQEAMYRECSKNISTVQRSCPNCGCGDIVISKKANPSAGRFNDFLECGSCLHVFEWTGI